MFLFRAKGKWIFQAGLEKSKIYQNREDLFNEIEDWIRSIEKKEQELKKNE